MKYLLILPVAAIIGLFVLAFKSKSGQAPGLQNNLLTSCPSKPNCVCSEYPDDTDHFISPLKFLTNDIEKIKNLVKGSIVAQGGTLISEKNNYLAFTFKTKLFGFVDDVEVRIDEDKKLIHLRSASRVGRSDLNANRKRMAALKAELKLLLGN